MPARILNIKICGYRSPQRYAVERTVQTALAILHEKYPEVKDEISAINDLQGILHYTQVLIYPALVINENLVCVGRFPKKEEVIRWLEKALTDSEKEETSGKLV
jgi:hypothetical protein